MFFLSASIPDPRRDPKYFETADIIAIRDAVQALASVIIPVSHLVWGGHPAISPLIRKVMKSMEVPVHNRVTLYQSMFFEREFPEDNQYFEHVIYTERKENKKDSLNHMRMRMLSQDGNNFSAGIFIGGMEGVEEEYTLFKQYNRNPRVLPIATTGAAAKIIYDQQEIKLQELATEYAYLDLFKSILQLNNR